LLEEWAQNGRVSFLNFYVRRGLRLLPPLLLLIVLCLIQVFIFPPPEGIAHGVKAVLVALCYLTNWMPNAVYPPLVHTWSLGIEEQFYIVWPVLLVFLLWIKMSHRGIVGLLLLLIAVIGIHRAMLWHDLTGLEQTLVFARLDARADALLVGCVAGILISRNMIPAERSVFALIRIVTLLSVAGLSVCLLAVPLNSRFLYYGGFTVVAVMVALIIANLFTAPWRLLETILGFGWLRWFGRLSYGLYLWHLPIYMLYDQFGPRFAFRSYTLSVIAPFPFKALLAIGVATLSFYFVEQPALRLKSRFSALRYRKDDRVLASAPLMPAGEASIR
jgi:peptidoglycan/LPS O-acetylase OafA/YrhL